MASLCETVQKSSKPNVFKNCGREFSVTCLRDESPLLFFYHMYSLHMQISLHIFCILCYTICMKKNYIHARTCVYNIHYHIVWCVKYRRKVLSPQISTRLYGLLRDIGIAKGFSVDLCKVGEDDHVHCFVTAPPKLSPTLIVKYLKGISGNTLLKEFPELRHSLWRGQLWNGSYFCETIGSVSAGNVRKYIERQKNCQL